MGNHYYRVIKSCPASLKEVVLTDTVKEYVMNNRVYHDKDDVKVTNQTINNYNTMNNFLANMNTIDKITRFAEYKQIELTSFEEKVEAKYEQHFEELTHDTFREPLELSQSQLMEIVDNLTKAIRGSQRTCFLEDFNFIYDSKRKRINIYSGRWEEYLVVNGIEYLILNIKDYYLEAYEIYLMRNLCKSGIDISKVNRFTKCLEDYYHFLSCFEIKPYCKGKYDNQILYNKEDERFDQEPDELDRDGYIISERFSKMYNDIYGAITNTERKSKQKELLDIIKSNSKNNLEELDKNIIDLVKVDADFKEGIFERRAIEV